MYFNILLVTDDKYRHFLWRRIRWFCVSLTPRALRNNFQFLNTCLPYYLISQLTCAEWWAYRDYSHIIKLLIRRRRLDSLGHFSPQFEC